MSPNSDNINFGIDNCIKLYNKLKKEHELLNVKWDENDFFNFTVTAWHLYHDWLNNDKIFRPKLAIKKKNKIPAEMKEVINISRDIANGNKHVVLDDKSKMKKVVTSVQPPLIRDAYSYFITGPEYAIYTKSAFYTTSDFRFLIIDYFSWLFDDSKSVADFPEQIISKLEYCKTK